MYVISQFRKILSFCILLVIVSTLYNFLYVDRDFIAKKQKLSNKAYQDIIREMQSKPLKRKFEIISIQTASKEELMHLPRIGPKMAERIISYRNMHPFKRISDLKKVKGIGDKTFKKMKKLIKL